MRAITLALLSLSPMLVFGQTTPAAGTAVITDEGTAAGAVSAVNITECGGGDDLTIQWTTNATSPPVSGNTYKIIATDVSECPVTTTTAKQYVVVDGLAATTGSNTQSYPSSNDPAVTANAVATGLGYSCTGAVDKTAYFCVQLMSAGTATGATAIGNIKYDLVKPDKPTGVVAIGIEGALKVAWTAVNGASTYKVRASAPGSDGGSGTKEQPASTNSVTISGLENDVAYTVTVVAVSVGGNEGEPSDAAQGTPRASSTAWELYEESGGRERGGCGFGGGSVLGLVTLLAALVSRRRK